MRVESVANLLRVESAKPQAAGGVHFSELINPNDAGERGLATREQTVRKAAQQLVAGSLVMPILSQARQDPFRTELFHGGKAEEMFNSQLDTTLADRITAKANFPLVDSVYRTIMQKANRGPARQGGAAAPARKELNLHG